MAPRTTALKGKCGTHPMVSRSGAVSGCCGSAEGCAGAAGRIVLAVLGELALLEPRMLAVVALAVLVAAAAGLHLRQDLYRQHRLGVETEQGIRQMERRLASRERA